MTLKNFLSKTLINPIWQAKQGHGSFLTFDMGSKSIRKKPNGKEYAKGEIHLWIYLCDWVIKKENEDLCHSESTNEEIAAIMPLFIGSVLQDIILVSPSRLDFYFSNGLLINLNNDTEFYSDDDDFFTLYLKEHNISYNQKNGFTIEESDKAQCQS